MCCCQEQRLAELDVIQTGGGMYGVKSKYVNKTRKFENKLRIRLIDYNYFLFLVHFTTLPIAQII
jgi:hypothetical protein